MADLGARAPKYHRVADELRREVQDGRLAPGERLPAETALAERFQVSVPTMRQAIGVLRAEGLIESRHGIGTFVRENRRLQRRSRNRYGRARQDKQLLTSALRHDIVYAGRGPVPDHIADAMNLPAGTEVVIRQRRLYDDAGHLDEIGASYLPADIAAGTYLEEPVVVPKALFLCVEELAGKRYVRARDAWISRLPTAEEATLFGLAVGMPVLHVVHTAWADDGTVLEVSESVWPADRVMFIDEYDIPQSPGQPPARSDV